VHASSLATRVLSRYNLFVSASLLHIYLLHALRDLGKLVVGASLDSGVPSDRYCILSLEAAHGTGKHVDDDRVAQASVIGSSAGEVAARRSIRVAADKRNGGP